MQEAVIGSFLLNLGPYPDTVATSPAKTTSDYTPCVIRIGTSIPRSRIFMFENFWLEHTDFKDVVRNIWEQAVDESDSAKVISAKFKTLRKGLKIWLKNLSDLKTTINNTNAVILLLDYLEEYKGLTTDEN